MTSELKRLASYKTWTSDTISPIVLARYGFQYTGQGDATECCECGIVLNDWRRGDDPVEKHRQLAPMCQFPNSANKNTEDRARRLQLASVNRSTVVEDSASNAAANNSTTLSAVHNTSHQSLTHTTESSSSSSTLGSGEFSDTAPPIDRDNPDYCRLKTERVRLETFHDWPSRAARIVSARDLAAAGLFYTGQSDRVQCAFCRGFLRNWAEGDSPVDKHCVHYPACPLVRGSDITSSRHDFKTGYFQDFQPTHPDFADVGERIQSFQGRRVPDGQRVDALAEAGFFHTAVTSGPLDNVQCFYCDGELRNWDPIHEPWTEHARWFPRCRYLLANRDERFVQNAQVPRCEMLTKNLPPNSVCLPSGDDILP